jgi:hypothetical protein
MLSLFKGTRSCERALSIHRLGLGGLGAIRGGKTPAWTNPDIPQELEEYMHGRNNKERKDSVTVDMLRDRQRHEERFQEYVLIIDMF